MIKNRIPLRNLLSFVLIVIVFFMACLAYALSFDVGRNTGIGVMFYIFIGLSFFFTISFIGLLNKGDGGRILLKVILFLIVICWTAFAGYLCFQEWGEFRLFEKVMLGMFTLIVYIFLTAGISFLNNEKLKEELK